MNDTRIDQLEISGSDDEDGYRRGYTQGYAQAVRDAYALARLGYGRAAERDNILSGHIGLLYAWRSFSGDRFETPPALPVRAWADVRNDIIRRDGSSCSLCGAITTSPHIDHINPVKFGGTPDPDNLRVLCAKCNLSRRY